MFWGNNGDIFGGATLLNEVVNFLGEPRIFGAGGEEFLAMNDGVGKVALGMDDFIDVARA